MAETTPRESRLAHAKGLLDGTIQMPKLTWEEMLQQADSDPLLLSIPTADQMRECVSRAKVLCHVFLEGGPLLDDSEKTLLDSLRPLHFFDATRRLLLTDLETPWESLADLPAERLRKTAFTERISDLVSAFALCEDADNAIRAVEEFFGDGLPFSSSRYLAMTEFLKENPGVRRLNRPMN